MYALAATLVTKFTGELEFWFDNAQPLMQVRSASRLGGSDLGANSTRMENIRVLFKH